MPFGWFDDFDLFGAAFQNRPLKDQLKDWLYSDNYDEQKLKEFEFLHHFPVVGDYMDYLLDLRGDKEYLDRYGMAYSDIHDPRKLNQSNSGTRLVGSSLNFVSKNIHRLYR